MMTKSFRTRLAQTETAWAKQMVARIRQLPPNVVLARLLGLEPEQLPSPEEMRDTLATPEGQHMWAELRHRVGTDDPDISLERHIMQHGIPPELRDLLHE